VLGALGARCVSAVATAPWSGTLRYAYRAWDWAVTGWSSSTSQAAAQAVLVLSLRGDELVDATVSAADGSFTVQLPADFTPATDRLVFALIATHADGSLAFAVARPDVPVGSWVVTQAPPAESSTFWSWSVDPSVVASGSTILIGEAQGSAAVRVFDWARYAVRQSESWFGKDGQSVLLWLAPEVTYSCGSCFTPWAAVVQGQAFASQIWLPASSVEQRYWSEALVAHELGHWAMDSFGLLPPEVGSHCLGTPTFAGQAYSEGWATAFSSVLRAEPRYFDVQGGEGFWFDLSTRSYWDSRAWARPMANAGLTQRLDENEVAAILWELATSAGVGWSAMIGALSSPRGLHSPPQRGYSAKSWSLGASCQVLGATDTSMSSAVLADFLDALRCSGISASALEQGLASATGYPYDVASPLCE